MKVTKQWLLKQDACSESVKFFLQDKNNDIDHQFKRFIKAKRSSDINWFLSRKLKRKEDKIRYAVFAAECVIDIYEKKHPDEHRPRKAIEAAKKVVEKDTKQNRYAAAAAADAAVDAANAAYAAYANAAYANAAYAAYAAADAADAAAYAAAYAYAANAAANAANAYAADAKNEMYKKIVSYGIKLLVTK